MKHSKYTKIESGKYVEWASWVLEYDQYQYHAHQNQNQYICPRPP